jgi:hypothetical protein
MKTNLLDTTFIIPVSYDHPDRLENLNLVRAYLNQHFDTNIIVGEIGTRQMDADVHFDYPTFHRTKALNEMTLMAKTPYVVNWDADVLVEPSQIKAMVEMLRAGVDVVYPYDGPMTMLPKEYRQIIKDGLSLAPLAGKVFRTAGATSHKDASFGGAVGFNKDAYMGIGGENEMHVSYSNEDYERYWRANMLGLKISRVPGTIYHVHHWRGNNSSFKHENGQQNLIVWKIQRNFSKDQLLKMINHPKWNNGMTLQDLADIK